MHPVISPEKMAEYRRGAQLRHQERVRVRDRRHRRAWQVAKKAAHLLRQEYGVEKVTVFGSLVMPGRFHERSDVDLAAWGLGADPYLKAVARLLSLDPQISVDLIRAEHAPPAVIASVEREGIPL